MKINKLDAHDRYQHFTKQSFDIAECCQDLINQRPFFEHPFYIFAHTRTLGLDEKLKLYSSGQYKTLEEVPEKSLIWQPRLTKPLAQSNSMLFKAYPGSDIIKVIWMLPAPELWGQYGKGLLTENKTVSESISLFRNDKKKLEEKEDDDMTDLQIDAIYKELASNARRRLQKDMPKM
jgi:hypothetical protein